MTGAIVFIVNPRSANGSTLRRFERAREQVVRELGEVEVRLTERPRHAAELARQAIRSGARAVIAVGGDGTNNEVINGFFDTDGEPVGDAAFGQVTSGTGGDFRRSFGWSAELREDIARIKRFDVHATDVGRCTFTRADGSRGAWIYLNSAGFGVNGSVVKNVNGTSKALGARVSFLAGTVKGFLEFEQQAVRYRIDDGPMMESDITLVTASNGQYFGGGMRIAPSARVDDGLLDVVVANGVALPTFLRHAPRIYAGTHTSLSFVRMYAARKLEAAPQRSGDRILVELDGEQPGMLPATFEVLPGALRLLA